MATSRISVVAVLAAGLAAVAAPAQAADLPVGHTVRQLTVPGTAQGEPRAVDVHLWYPTAAAGPKAVYSSALRGRSLGTDLWSPLTWTVEAEIAREGAAIDPAGAPFPVIVFSHGNTNDPIDYAHTLELIAAGGFIVAAPGHTNNTQDDARMDFVNDAVAGGRPRVFAVPRRAARPVLAARAPDSMADRVKDISAVLDALARLVRRPRRRGQGRHDRALARDRHRARRRRRQRRAGRREPVPGDADALLAARPPSRGSRPSWAWRSAQLRHARRQLARRQGADAAGRRRAGPDVAAGGQRSAPSTTCRSADKTLVTLPNGVHRSFDSTYCDQVQAAGTIAKADAEGDPRPAHVRPHRDEPELGLGPGLLLVRELRRRSPTSSTPRPA